jgi:hypothetical protein
MSIMPNQAMTIARMEAMAQYQRAQMPDVQENALQRAVDAKDLVTAAEIARTIRNRLLKESDFQMLPDRPETKESGTYEEWAQYRQALRDLTKSKSWPLAIRWPQAPGAKEEEPVI